MARISKQPPPGHWKLGDREGRTRCANVDRTGTVTFPEEDCPDWRTHMDRETRSLSELPADLVWRTPVADGHAYYYVRSQAPHIFLSHIPYGDAWKASPALLRGIRKNELLQDIRREKIFRELVEKDQAEKDQAEKEERADRAQEQAAT